LMCRQMLLECLLLADVLKKKRYSSFQKQEFTVFA
jgi:hypothetical protein